MIRAGALAFLLLVTAAAMEGPESAAESAPQTTSATTETQFDSITVEARRERINRQVNEFVTSIVLPVKHESLARWQVPICVRSAGLTAAKTEFVEKRISQIASDAGVPLGPQGCAPNFMIVVTPEPQALLKEWWSEDHDLFNRDRGIGGVKRMIRTDQPVRVWHNACNVAPGLAKVFELSGQPACGTGALGSRLTWATMRSIYSVIVVVDLTRIEGMTFGQVADYVAMVGLAQIRRDPELGEVPTILGVFAADGAERQRGLTAWDQSFLKAVYETMDGSVMELAQVKLRMGVELAR